MEITPQRRVKPTRPIAAYIGGKKRLAPAIVARIGEIRHDGYAEPFIGMGGIFLRREAVPRVEVINDVSDDVVTLFRVVQRHRAALEEELRYQLTARSAFQRLQQIDPATLTDIERAARFLYLQRTAFGGKVAGRTFGVSPGEPGPMDIRKVRDLISALADRLAGVTIENLPYGEFISRYDRPGMLFYLDPPYYGSEGDYGADVFPRSEFERMAEHLAGIRGAFLLSINDTLEVRRIFGAFPMEPLRLSYSVARGAATEAAELLISDAATARCERRQASLFSI